MNKLVLIFVSFMLFCCAKVRDNQNGIKRVGIVRNASSNSKDEDYNIHYHHYLDTREALQRSYFEVARKYADTCISNIPITAIYFIDKSADEYFDFGEEYWYLLPKYIKAKVAKKWVNDSSFNLIEFYSENEIKTIEVRDGIIQDSYRDRQ